MLNVIFPKKKKEQEELDSKAEEKAKVERETEVTNYINSVKSQIDELEEISGFQMTTKLKKILKTIFLSLIKKVKHLHKKHLLILNGG